MTKKEWKNIQTHVFQNHFSETNWKRSIEEKAPVTFSVKDRIFFTYECELVYLAWKVEHL